MQNKIVSAIEPKLASLAVLVYQQTYKVPTPDSRLFVTDKMANLLFDGIPYKFFSNLGIFMTPEKLAGWDIELNPKYKIEVSSIIP